MIKIIFLGDCVGKVGRQVLKDQVKDLKREFEPVILIANGENAAGGVGIDPGTADEIFGAGVDVITTGNHVWSKKDLIPYLERNPQRIVRPANYPIGSPGRGYTIWRTESGHSIAVVNVMGRIFMNDLVECPFRTVDRLISDELTACDFTFFDFHGEATSEKVAMGYFLDGRATAVVGTHTHVQTADSRILPGGTAYITDVGMCGPKESVIGVKRELVIERFLTGRPIRFEVAEGEGMLNGVVITCDPNTRRATAIERLFRYIPLPRAAR